MTASIVGEEFGGVVGLPTVTPARIDARPLLGGMGAGEVLLLLTPEAGMWFAPTVVEYAWTRDWESWFDGCGLAQNVLRSAENEHDLVFGPEGTTVLGEVDGAFVVMDDLAAGWEWVAQHRWHKIVGWGVDLTRKVGGDRALSGVNRFSPPPPLLTRWQEDVHWVAGQAGTLLANTSWVRRQGIIFRGNTPHCEGEAAPQHGYGGPQKLSERYEVAAWGDAEEWVEYLIGYDAGSPKMLIGRAFEYAQAGMGAVEARQYEFGPLDNRPTLETLHTLKGLVEG